MQRNLSSARRRSQGRHADPVDARATPLKFPSKDNHGALGYAAANRSAFDGQA
jgi:hypothetical protein